MDHPLDRAFAFWGKLCAQRPWAVLSLGLLLTLGFGWSASGLRSDLSFIGILDEDDPAMTRLADPSATPPEAVSGSTPMAPLNCRRSRRPCKGTRS